MKLTPEQRTELIEKLYDEMIYRCRDDTEYLLNVLREVAMYEEDDDETLLQQHIEYFDEEFIEESDE